MVKEIIKRIILTTAKNDEVIIDPFAGSGTTLKIAKELGEQMSADELRDMLERASSNGQELTFDEFYEIMTKRSFP